MAIGDRIKQVRGRLSREEFALKIGTDKSTVQRYENNNDIPKGDILLRIHQEFDTDITWLLTGKGQSPPEEKGKNNIPLKEPGVDYDVDPFSRAVSALKEVFDSHDPALINAVSANLYVFRLYTRKDKQLKQQLDKSHHQSDELAEMHKEIDDLKNAIAGFECKKDTVENL